MEYISLEFLLNARILESLAFLLAGDFILYNGLTYFEWYVGIIGGLTGLFGSFLLMAILERPDSLVERWISSIFMSITFGFLCGYYSWIVIAFVGLLIGK